MADLLNCLLIGGRGGGGEEVFLRDLVRSPPPGVQYHPVWDPHGSVPGARANRFREVAFNRLIQPRFWPLSGLRSYSVSRAFDVVHVHNFSHRIRPSTPVVMTLGGATYWHYMTRYLSYTETRVQRLYAQAGPLYRRLGVANEFANWEQVRAIIVFSQYAKGFLTRAGVPGERVHVVPPGFPDPGRTPPPRTVQSERALQVLLVGRDPDRKGVDLALAACRALRGRGKPVDLTLVGDPSYPALGGDGIRGIGPVPVEEVRARYMPSADVVVVPSRAEGYGFAAAEGLAAGRPVIVSDEAALPEIVSVPEWVVPVGSSEALARALERLTDSPSLLESEALRARRRFEKEFTVKIARERLRSVYDVAVGKPATGSATVSHPTPISSSRPQS